MGGGAPLTVDGKLVAGVGVSGGTVEQDVEILESALREPAVASALDMKLEVVVIPVSDVDRAKRFYSDLGWRLDIDYASGDDYRVIQFTPPGSGCSIIFGNECYVGCAGLGERRASDRLRHRGCSPRTARAVALRSANHSTTPAAYSTMPAPKDRLSGPKSRAKELRFIRLVQRSRRQRLGTAGGHRTTDRTHRAG